MILGLLAQVSQAQNQTTYYLTAERVFDGQEMHAGWAVVVEGNKIVEVGPRDKVKAPSGATSISRPNATLLPGLIEGHAHLLLYPYNITDWNTQVLKESDSYRTIRATVHARQTLLAGFTTVRDLGSEGAGYSDVALKNAINNGIIIGPRLIVAGRAIVATGSYGPKGYDNDMEIMLGAEAADGNDLIRVTRDQIGKGADIIKVYADYRWGPNGDNRPTFSQEELTLIHDAAQSSGRPMVCHANLNESIRRAVLAGVETVEHGDFLNLETAQLMKAHDVVFIPTIAAGEKISQYHGWIKGKTEPPEHIAIKKKSFAAALQSGVTIGMGGDVGVFAHGENVLEMELMVEYGMPTIQVLRAATTVNARAFHVDQEVGAIKPGLKADIIIVDGDPSKQISDLRKVKLVMKDGVLYKNEN